MTIDRRACAFIFPGQGSQFLGMGQDLANWHPAAMRTFEEADSILGFPFSQIMWSGSVHDLNCTINTQPAVFIHSIAVIQVLKDTVPDLQPVCLAGHSLGELSALATIESFSFEDGIRLVRKRAELMEFAGTIAPGGMAAIIGLEIADVAELCSQITDGGKLLQIANDNCPGQVVVSGTRDAIEEVVVAAKTAGARRVIPLAVSIAAHSELMSVIQADFSGFLDDTPMVDASIPVISNVSAEPMKSSESLRDDLRAQLTKQVRWRETIRRMVEKDGIDTFVEIGPGSVLTGLLKRIAPNAKGISIGSPADIEAAFR